MLAYHTYRVRKDGKDSIQHEGRIKLHTESDHNASPAAEQQPDHQTVEQTMGPGDSIGDLLIKSSKWQEDEKTHRAAEMKMCGKPNNNETTSCISVVPKQPKRC